MSAANKNHGGVRKGAGRKSKSEEHDLASKLSPLNDVALEALKKGLKNEQNWAVKLFFEYFYGKPAQSVDITSKGESMSIPTVNFTKRD